MAQMRASAAPDAWVARGPREALTRRAAHRSQPATWKVWDPMSVTDTVYVRCG